MSVFTEKGLRISFPDGVAVRKFDAPDTHGRLDRGMRAVDFIVELSDRFIFIEVKEPQELAGKGGDGRHSDRAHRPPHMRGLVRQFRDSFIYEWAMGRANKPIIYIVLVGLEQIAPVELTNHTDALRWWLPERGPFDKRWVRPLVADCAVMDLVVWNRNALTRDFSASRVSG